MDAGAASSCNEKDFPELTRTTANSKCRFLENPIPPQCRNGTGRNQFHSLNKKRHVAQFFECPHGTEPRFW